MWTLSATQQTVDDGRHGRRLWDVQRNGKAIEVDKAGNRFEGSYNDDVRDGKYVEKDRNGNIVSEGTYVRGRKQ